MKQEDILHIRIANLLREYEMARKLACVFWSYMPFGEQRTKATGGLLKKKGVKRGVPDYLFVGIHGYHWIEIKSGKNQQTSEQIQFQEMIRDIPCSYYEVCRTLEEVVQYLEEYNLIITK
jgi:hypothetical protein